MNRKQGPFFQRHAAFLLAAFAIATPFLLDAAYRAVRSNTNKVADWLPKTYVETGDLKWFREHFAGDQFVIISWDGCRIGGDPRQPGAEPDDPRIDQLAKMLVPEPGKRQRPVDRTVSPLDLDHGSDDASPWADDADDRSYHRFFKTVITGRQMLDRLTSSPMDVPYDLAVKRLSGSLIGPDGHQTCLVAMFTDDAIGQFRAAIGRGNRGWLRVQHREGALFKALRACDIDTDTVHLGGPPVENVSIDEEGECTLVRLAGLSGLVGLVLSWWSLRSVKLTLIVFSCGLLSAAACLAAVWITGETTDAILLSMPALVYVLAISGAVHLINYYRDALQDYGPAEAPWRAIAHGWKPALFCSITTAMGLLSLETSDLTPIRKFGTYSALGVILMLVILFVYLPAILQLAFGQAGRAPWRRQSAGRKAETRRTVVTGSGRWEAFWQVFGGWIIRHHVGVTVGCTVLILGVGLGITRIRTNIDLLKLFGSEARILKDYQWLEANVGRLVPLEVVLKFDRDAVRGSGDTAADKQRFSLLERIKIVADVQRGIGMRFGSAGEDVIGPSLSAATFVPPLPKSGRGMSAVVLRSATNSRLEGSYDALQDSGYLKRDMHDGAELWRISVRVAAFKNVDYGQFAAEIRNVVDPIVAQHNSKYSKRWSDPNSDAEASRSRRSAIASVYTGVVPIVYKAQHALLESLIDSTFWSFITITPLLMFVSRGIRAGAVAMMPNVLPILVVFGGMGWLNVPIDIGSMMSASIALGVAVDDTIHFLTWFRDDLNRSQNRHSAILSAYRRCATPTLQAALINGLGLSVFAFSTFTPTRKFGFLMLTILLAGMVAELILLPALLAGPLGRAFRSRPVTIPAREYEPAEAAA